MPGSAAAILRKSACVNPHQTQIPVPHSGVFCLATRRSLCLSNVLPHELSHIRSGHFCIALVSRELTLMLKPALALVSMNSTPNSRALASPSSMDTCLWEGPPPQPGEILPLPFLRYRRVKIQGRGRVRIQVHV